MGPEERVAGERVSLCALDVLPSKCSLEAEVDGTRVRFRAKNRFDQHSLWSGWFSVSEAPIRLAWRAFDWPEETELR